MKQNINSLLGYSIKGTDGEIGTLEDIYFDDRTSTIRNKVVETRGWFSKKKFIEMRGDNFINTLTNEKKRRLRKPPD